MSKFYSEVLLYEMTTFPPVVHHDEISLNPAQEISLNPAQEMPIKILNFIYSGNLVIDQISLTFYPHLLQDEI